MAVKLEPWRVSSGFERNLEAESFRKRWSGLWVAARWTSLIQPNRRLIRGTFKEAWLLRPCSEVLGRLSSGPCCCLNLQSLGCRFTHPELVGHGPDPYITE